MGFDLDNMKMGGFRNGQVAFGVVTFEADSLTATVATQLTKVDFAIGILTSGSLGSGENAPVATFATSISDGNVTLTRQTMDASTTPTYFVMLVGC